MRTLWLIVSLSLTLPSLAQSPLSGQWGQLLNEKKYSQTEKLCTSWTHSPTLATQVEAQKCLANVALCKGQQLTLMGNDQGGGSLGEGYAPKAVDEALEHLNEGLRLSPQDLSIHEGRLHILEVSGGFDDMAKALDQSISMMPETDVSHVWLPYTAELADMGQIAAGLRLSLVLNAYYPNSHDVIGNIGAFYNMLKQPENSLPYLQKAVELSPNDALDNWNLGRALDFSNQTSEADKFYSKALTLDPESTQMPGSKCLYAQFVQNKLRETARACLLEKADCETERQAACAATPPPSTSDKSDTSHPQSP